MTMRSHHMVMGVVAVVLVAGCSADRPADANAVTPAPTAAPAGDAALGAYAEFWRVTSEALAAPGSRDWSTELNAVATGQALQTALGDVTNYASLPAHTVGAVLRDPRIDTATDAQVSILDCVGLGDSRLVSDKTGQPLDDLANRTVRYRYRADVVRTAAGTWLVDRTAPALDEPC